MAKIDTATSDANDTLAESQSDICIGRDGIDDAREEGSRYNDRLRLEFLRLIGDGKASVRVWDRPIIMRSEQYGTTLVMPQLS